MFDCVLPTRLGRTGTALTWEGRLNLKNARHARDPAPLQEDCECPACTRFSRAYIRHLVNQQELLGLRLLSLHNLRFLLDLTAGARTAIERGEFAAYKQESLARLGTAAASEEAAPGVACDADMEAAAALPLRPSKPGHRRDSG
jgi:queuine tRNA-ribosyltransferase